MPEVLTAPESSTKVHPQVASFLATLPADIQNDTTVQQIVSGGGDPSAVIAQLQAHPQVQAFINNTLAQATAVPAATTQTANSAYDAVSAILMDKLTVTETRKNEQTGAEEAARVMKFETTDANSADKIIASVPVTKITMHDQMQDGREQLLFKVHVDDKNTIYQQDMAREIAAKIVELHPDFKPSAENPQPVRASSEHFDNSISFIADIPQGKTANIITAEIQHPEKYVPPVTPAASSETPAVAASGAEAAAVAAPVVNVKCGDTTVIANASNEAPVVAEAAATTNVTSIDTRKALTPEEVTAQIIAQQQEAAALPVAGGFTSKVPAPRPITPEGAATPDGTGLAKIA